MGASPAGAAEARQSFSILRGRAGLSPLSQADPTRRESRLAGNAGEVVSGAHPDGVTAGVTATPPDRGVLLGPLRSPVGDPCGGAASIVDAAQRTVSHLRGRGGDNARVHVLMPLA